MTLEQIFIRDCLSRTNAIHQRAEQEYRRMLLSFLCLGLILAGAVFALIHFKFEPGYKMVQTEEAQP